MLSKHTWLLFLYFFVKAASLTKNYFLLACHNEAGSHFVVVSLAINLNKGT